VNMHLYVRIILDGGPESSSEGEEQRLRECVRSAPGVEAVKEITKHVKGGYSATLEGHAHPSAKLLPRRHAPGIG